MLGSETLGVKNLLLLLMLAVAGHAAEIPIQSVEIKVMPEQGMAFCRYTRDGKLHGGHVSGGPAVNVHEANGQVKKPIIDEIWTLASDLRKRGVVSGPVSWDNQSRRHHHIVVSLEGGTELRLSWREKGQPSDKVARKLADLLLRHHIGGW